MTTFDERERAFEKKFALDEETKFRAEARRDNLVAQWAVARLGLTGQAADEYIRALRNEGVVHKGEGVLLKLRKDLEDAGQSTSEGELRDIMREAMTKAAREIGMSAKA
jgi:hypothetical protein